MVSFAGCIVWRTLLLIFIVILVRCILIFVHMSVGFLSDPAVHVIVLASDVYGRTCCIVIFMDVPVVKGGFSVHIMDMTGIIGITACHTFIIMPVSVVDRCFA